MKKKRVYGRGGGVVREGRSGYSKHNFFFFSPHFSVYYNTDAAINLDSLQSLMLKFCKSFRFLLFTPVNPL